MNTDALYVRGTKSPGPRMCYRSFLVVCNVDVQKTEFSTQIENA